MAIGRIRRSICTGLFLFGVGLLLTYLYTKAIDSAPKLSISKRQSDGTLGRSKIGEIDDYSKSKSKISEGDCRFVKPRFNHTVSSYKDIQMIFFGKPIMQCLKTIAMERHWRMSLILNDSATGLSRLHNYLTADSFAIIITSSRFYKHQAIQDLSHSENVVVSAIRYAFKVAGGKKGQLMAFREHFSKFGCDLDLFSVMPRSFLLDDTKDCLQFFKFANNNPNSWWVLKESGGYGGTGISIHTNLSKLYTDFSLCTNSKEYIAQQYLPDLLLINKRKFDVRGLVLIASTEPYYLFHHEGYLRVSMKEFSFQADKEAHITNSHLQMRADNFNADEHLWSFERFQSYLDKHHPENDNFVKRHLIPFIKETALFILQTGRSTVFTPAPSNYQLLGLDFMVTADLHVWFIEANNYPLWPVGSKHIDKFMHTMGNEMFDLLFDLRHSPLKFAAMTPGDRYKSWDLVWSELDEKCSNRTLYNPCSFFTSAY